MYTGQKEKYIAAVFTFGIPTTIAQNLTRYLGALGVTPATTTNELAVIVPRDGILRNLYWSCDLSGLTGSNHKITVYVNGTAILDPVTGKPLEAAWNGNVKSGLNITESIVVTKGQRVSARIQLTAGGTTVTRFRVSFEFEVDADYPNPWDYDPASKIISYTNGNVGIGTTTPSDMLTVNGPIKSALGGFKFPDGSVQTTAAVSGGGGGGGIPGISASGGKIGIGLDPTRTPQEKLTLAPDSNLVTEMPTPSGVAVAASPVSGGLPMDDYFFRVTASDGAGWTKASAQLIFNLADPDHGIRISWNSVLGATKYRVYRALTAAGAYKYIEVINTYYDYISDADFTLAGAPPDETTAYINKLSAAGDSWLLGGDVGVGTTNPTARLHIASGNVRVEGGNAGTGFENYNQATFINSITQGASHTTEFRTQGDFGFYTLATSNSSGTERLTIKDNGNVGIGTTTPRDTLDIGGASSPASSFGIGFGKMKSQVTSVPANTPTAVYSSGNGELIGTLYIFIGGGGNSTMSEYRLITNSDGADRTTSKLTLVDSLSRGSPPFFFDEPFLSNLGDRGAINVIMRFNTATTVRAVFVGLENHY